MTTSPTVSVVIPVLNEEVSIARTLEAVGRQTYEKIVEVLVVDGGSTDRTVEVARSAPGVRVITNPGRIQAAGLNAGIDAAVGEIIVRLDAHCLPADDYVACCIAALQQRNAAMVGGSMRPDASGWPGDGIGAAMASRLGAGPALFHRAGREGWVDTVWMGAFRRADALLVGGYDASLPVNEDADFARRLRHRGGVWLDRWIVCRYQPRTTYHSLARQFFRYGQGRATTTRRCPSSASPRQLVAPVLVLGLLSPVRRVVAIAYLGAVVTATVAQEGGLARRCAYGIALPTMHVSWGSGFLLGLVRPLTRKD